MAEDELFGDLTADDHADDHERAVNPQQAASAASAIAMRSRLSEVGGGGGGGGLAGHETRSNEATFHKMGYLEAYDATKEERLQEGFEVGFREAADHAHSIGRRLGQLVGRTAASSATGGDDEDGTRSKGDQQVKRDADAVASKLVARTIRAFLDEQMTQQSDAVSADESLKELQDLEKMVRGQSKEEATSTE